MLQGMITKALKQDAATPRKYLLPNSPTDLRNALAVCEQCDDPYERHYIEIDEKGKVIVKDEWIEQLTGNKKKKYFNLRGTFVPWHDKIGAGNYPSVAMLRWRKSLPYVKSREGKALIKQFNQEAIAAGRHNIASDSEEEEEEDEEQAGAKSSRKQSKSSRK